MATNKVNNGTNSSGLEVSEAETDQSSNNDTQQQIQKPKKLVFVGTLQMNPALGNIQEDLSQENKSKDEVIGQNHDDMEFEEEDDKKVDPDSADGESDQPLIQKCKKLVFVKTLPINQNGDHIAYEQKQPNKKKVTFILPEDENDSESDYESSSSSSSSGYDSSSSSSNDSRSLSPYFNRNEDTFIRRCDPIKPESLSAARLCSSRARNSLLSCRLMSTRRSVGHSHSK